MTTLEDRLRDTLHDMADEVQPAPLLQRLENRPEVHTNRRRLVAVTAAAAAAAVVAATSYVVLRGNEPSIVEPIQRPPKVFRLSDVTTTAPGRAVMAVTLARPKLAVPGGEHEDPLYLLPANGATAVYIPARDAVPYSYFDGLSTDGTRLIRANEHADNPTPRLELLDLVTGRSQDLGGREIFCPRLSSDNATVAGYGLPDVHIIDVRSGASRVLYPLNETSEFRCGGLGWSPDGRQLVVRTQKGSVVVDRQGTVRLDLPQSYAVNSSMSWSPDGRLLLTYNRLDGDYEVVPADGGQTVVMRRPTDAQQPLGWAGARVVWLAGQPGGYRLVTTDVHGEDVRTWMRFDIGDRPIQSVSWSRALSGTAKD